MVIMSLDKHLLYCLKELTDKQLRTYVFLMAKGVVEISAKELSKEIHISPSTLKDSLSHLTQLKLIETDKSIKPNRHECLFKIESIEKMEGRVEGRAEIRTDEQFPSEGTDSPDSGRTRTEGRTEIWTGRDTDERTECEAEKLGYKPSKSMPGLYVDKDNFLFNPDGSLWEDFSIEGKREMKEKDIANENPQEALTKNAYTTSSYSFNKWCSLNEVEGKSMKGYKQDNEIKNDLDEKDFVVSNDGQDRLKEGGHLVNDGFNNFLTKFSEKDRHRLVLEHIRSIGNASMITWEPDGKKMISFTSKDNDELILEVIDIVLRKGYEHRIFPTKDTQLWLELFSEMDEVEQELEPKEAWSQSDEDVSGLFAGEEFDYEAGIKSREWVRPDTKETDEEENKKYAKEDYDFLTEIHGEPPSIFNPVVVKSKSKPSLANKILVDTESGIDLIREGKGQIEKSQIKQSEVNVEDEQALARELTKAQKRLDELREKAKSVNVADPEKVPNMHNSKTYGKAVQHGFITQEEWIDIPEEERNRRLRDLGKAAGGALQHDIEKVLQKPNNIVVTDRSIILDSSKLEKEAQSLPPFTTPKDTFLSDELQTEGDLSRIEQENSETEHRITGDSSSEVHVDEFVHIEAEGADELRRMIREMSEDLQQKTSSVITREMDSKQTSLISEGEIDMNVLLDSRDDDYVDEHGERSNEAKVEQYLQNGIDVKLEQRANIFFKKVIGGINTRWDQFKESIPRWYSSLGEEYIILAWNKSVEFANRRGKERFFAFISLLDDPNLDEQLLSIWNQKNGGVSSRRIVEHGIEAGDTVITDKGQLFEVISQNETDLFYWDKDANRSKHFSVFLEGNNQQLKNFRKLSDSELADMKRISEFASSEKNSEFSKEQKISENSSEIENSEKPDETFDYSDYLKGKEERLLLEGITDELNE